MAMPTKEEIEELENSLSESQFSRAIQMAYNAGYDTGKTPPMEIWRNMLLMSKGMLKGDLPKE